MSLFAIVIRHILHEVAGVVHSPTMNTMDELKELELLVAVGTPVIHLQTREENRMAELLRRISTRTGKPLFHWSVTRGLRREGSSHAFGESREPLQALNIVAGHTEAGLYAFYDFHAWIGDPVVIRQVRELALQHAQRPHTLFLVSSDMELPDELSGVSATFQLALPGRKQLEELIHHESAIWGQRNKRRVQAKAEVIERLINVLTGLTMNQAQRLVKAAIHEDGVLSDEDIPGIVKIKYQLMDAQGVLSFEFDQVSLDDIAGLRRMKEWLQLRKVPFLATDAPPGLDAPKGLLLLGVQGGGKSMAAKAVAGGWGLPLLRLDFGAMFNKYYGETEKNLRESLHTAEAMAPCVLWIDEIEKGLSGNDEGGVSKRILGTLLTWMAERRQKVFLVATANDIESLPPELLRKGRFDEIFFVDLPGASVREKIFEIHLRKRGQDPGAFDLHQLADAADGFTGAEIEQSIVSALYASHYRNDALSITHLLSALRETQPLSVIMREKIAALRNWARERTVPAD
ncbi:MAG TPA: AAA family ATPase [Gammaproteobacteria bacterium]|nr:AAA family ATPase [Gammaproteobacteria bacterium]